MSFTHNGRTLQKVAVIGSGQIGPDIALYFAKVLAPHGVPIVVVDVAEEALKKGRAKVEKKIHKGVESGAFTEAAQQEMLSRLDFTSDYERVRGADLVVEAATEDKGLKRRIFAQVEGLVTPDAVLASNSSHLEPEAIFADAKRPGRCAVVHYFFPAERNVIVEVVPGHATDPAVTRWLLSFYEAIGKVPIQVKSRYGYALDPVFEGLFLACALIAESGRATPKQIDTVATKALGMTVGSFTAMNLTGGNPITNIGLAGYHTKIHKWFHAPPSLREKVQTGAPWDAPQRGERIDVPSDLAAEITDELRGAYFGLCCEILDAGLVTVADFDMALELALDMKPAFTLMNELGTAQALRLVQAYARKHQTFLVPQCLAQKGAKNEPFVIPTVLRRDEGDVAVLTIRRPKVLNALNAAVFAEFRQRFGEVKADPAIKAAVLTGFGRKAFVSGADVNFLARIETPAQGEATSRSSNEVLSFIEDLGKPVVCAMNGLAFGGGNELAMACTMRIAVADAKVLASQPETNIGIIPGAGGSQRLPRLIGVVEAAALLRTARALSPSEAHELGLVAELVAADELVARAIQLARDLAAGKIKAPAMPEDALRDVPATLPEVDIGHRSKAVDRILCRAILEGAHMRLAEGLALESKCFGEVCGTQDMRIGVENFLANGPRAPAAFVHR